MCNEKGISPSSFPSVKVTTVPVQPEGGGWSGVGGGIKKSQLSSLVVNQEYVSLPSLYTLGSGVGHLCRNLDLQLQDD